MSAVEDAKVVVPYVEVKERGNCRACGSESVHVLSALKSCAPAEEVIWFAVPATVSARVGFSGV